jgi:hypothetical protein
MHHSDTSQLLSLSRILGNPPGIFCNGYWDREDASVTANVGGRCAVPTL